MENTKNNNTPKLGRWASWRKKRNLRAIARRDEKAIAKQKEKEMEQNDQITKQSLRNDYAWSAVISALTIGNVVVGMTAGIPLIAFLAGFAACVGGIGSVLYIKDAVQNHKEYRKQNPKQKKVKENKKEKQKEKKLGLGKRIKNFFSKSKNKSEDSNYKSEKQPEILNSNPIDSNQTTVSQPTLDSKDNDVALRYSLDQNDPRINVVDLSNVSIKPGLDIDVQHFIVNKEDELMQNLVEQYIEKSTGTIAMYADRIIDDEEKRVYMLTKYSQQNSK